MADADHIKQVVQTIMETIKDADPTVFILLHEKLEDIVTDPLELEPLTTVRNDDGTLVYPLTLECPHCFEHLLSGDVKMVDTKTRVCSTEFSVDSDGDGTIWADSDTYAGDVDVALRCSKCGLSVREPTDWELDWK